DFLLRVQFLLLLRLLMFNSIIPYGTCSGFPEKLTIKKVNRHETVTLWQATTTAQRSALNTKKTFELHLIKTFKAMFRGGNIGKKSIISPTFMLQQMKMNMKYF